MSTPSDSDGAVLAAETEINRLPPSGRKFPCGKCGARLDFDPTIRGLKCPYCGHEETIAPAAKAVEERDWEQFWENRAGEETLLAGHSKQVACTSCGAVVLLEDKVATDRCPYCCAHLDNQPEAAKAMVPPEGTLPFAVSQRQAIEAFNDWVAGRWFAPSSFRQFANLGKLTGVYVPYWTYDSMTYSHYTGQRGDNYVVTETYTETDANGQQVTKTRQVTHIRWTSVSGDVDHFFDDILICASRGLPEKFVGKLVPWDLESLEGFQPQFLSGFQTERYGVGLREGFEQAREIMHAQIRQLCTRDIGGDHQRLDSLHTQHLGVTFKHILLPIWLAAYRFHDKPFQILINARTGKVVGSRPYSWLKITSLIVGIIALIIALIVLFSRH